MQKLKINKRIKCNWRKAKKILSKAAVPAIVPNQFT
jgi:hypothetical protein